MRARSEAAVAVVVATKRGGLRSVSAPRKPSVGHLQGDERYSARLQYRVQLSDCLAENRTVLTTLINAAAWLAEAGLDDGVAAIRSHVLDQWSVALPHAPAVSNVSAAVQWILERSPRLRGAFARAA